MKFSSTQDFYPQCLLFLVTVIGYNSDHAPQKCPKIKSDANHLNFNDVVGFLSLIRSDELWLGWRPGLLADRQMPSCKWASLQWTHTNPRVQADPRTHNSLKSISDALSLPLHWSRFISISPPVAYKHTLTHRNSLSVFFYSFSLFYCLHWVPLCGAPQAISLIVFFIRELQQENTTPCSMNLSQLSVPKLAHSAALLIASATVSCLREVADKVETCRIIRCLW